MKVLRFAMLCAPVFLLAALGTPARGQGLLDIGQEDGQVRLDWLNLEPGWIVDWSGPLDGDPVSWRPFALYPETGGQEELSIFFDPFVQEGLFRLREDFAPTQPRRTPLSSGGERLAWAFSYVATQLEYSDDGGTSWRLSTLSPHIDFLAGEFAVELPGQPDTRVFRLRTNRPPALDGPDSATVPIGEQGSFHFPAFDEDGDPLRYSVEGLPEGARFDPVINQLTFNPGQEAAGSYAIRISVSDATYTTTSVFTITVPEPPQRTTTGLAGRVLDANASEMGSQLPIVGVIVTLLDTGARTTTGANGDFAFDDVPGGLQVLNFDPTEAAPGPNGELYAGFREEFTLLPLIANRITRPIYLPRLAVESLTEIVTTETVVVENAAIGVRITIPPNTAMAGGTMPFTGRLSISEVPRGFEPAAMPPDLQPAQLITIQPVGVTFSQPVPITFPNRSALEVGGEVDIWSLDAGTGMFIVVGKGRVSADGQRIETISGGVRATDWHFVLPIAPEGAAAADANGASSDCQAGSEFTLHTGELTASFASPPWLSMGVTRELRFHYASRQAHPEITIPVELRMPPRVPAPQAVALSAILPNGGSAQSPVWLSGQDLRGGGVRRSAVTVRATGMPTGVHTVSVQTTSQWSANLGIASNARRGGIFDVEVPVVNRTQSPYGMGWSVAGVQSIHLNPELPGVALLVEDNVTRVFDRRLSLRNTPLFRYGAPIQLADRYLDSSGTLGNPVTGDFDGDGILDLAIRHSGEVLVLRGRGDGTFEFLYAQPVSIHTITQMIGADFDQDGWIDLATVSRRTSLVTTSEMHVLRGLGNGVFSSPDNYPITSMGVQSLAAGDTGGDGTLDLIAARDNSGIVSFKGRGDGTFEDPVLATLPSAQCPGAIVLADLNNDGRDDVIGLRFNGVHAALSDGAGDFTSPAFAGSNTLRSMHVGNFNGGAGLEVLFSSEETLRLLEWEGGALVNRGVVGTIPERARDQAPGFVGDIDGDGSLDAIITTTFNQFTIAYGDGQGGFSMERYIPQPASLTASGGFRLPDEGKDSASALAADFNGDGFTDIVHVADHGPFNGAVAILGGPGRQFQAPRYPRGGGLEGGVGPEQPVLAVAGDFNNDGIDDVLYAGSGPRYWFNAGRADRSFADGIVALPTANGRANYGTSLAAADFDQDGNLDIVYPAAHSSRRITSVQWGAGDGTFVVIPQAGIENGWVGYETTSGLLRGGIAAGDVNSDGYPDYVVAHRSTVPSVWLYDPTSPRSFTGPFPITDSWTMVNSHQIASGDLNLDGQMDVVCFEYDFAADRQSLYFVAFISEGDGSFRSVSPDFSGFTQGFDGGGIPFTYDIAGAARAAAIADLNRDGKPDLLFSHPNGVWFMSGDGTGVLAAPRLVSSYSGVTETLGLADLNGDGAPEAIVSFRNGPSGGSTWGNLVLPNVGGRQIFGPAIPAGLGFSMPSRFLSVDPDGDGRDDLIVVNPSGVSEDGPFAILLNALPEGGFDPAITVPAPVTYSSPPGDFSILTQMPDGSWERRLPDGSRILFDSLGRQIAASNRRGHTMHYTYLGDSGQLDTITDPGGREIRFDYSGGQLASVQTPAGALRFRYDESGSPLAPAPGARLTSAALPGGAVRRFTYAEMESTFAR